MPFPGLGPDLPFWPPTSKNLLGVGLPQLVPRLWEPQSPTLPPVAQGGWEPGPGSRQLAPHPWGKGGGDQGHLQ